MFLVRDKSLTHQSADIMNADQAMDLTLQSIVEVTLRRGQGALYANAGIPDGYINWPAFQRQM
jgi:hypothetical protein